MDLSSRKLSTTGESLYQTLEIPKDSSLETIRKTYRRLALKYHPDKNLNNPEAAEKFKAINHAHTILMDDTKKEIYDKYGSLGLYIADHLGEANVQAYFTMTSKWFKGLWIFCGLITGCYFCCCCCCCCCFNFCCGKCRPQIPKEDDIPTFDGDDEHDGADDEITENKPLANDAPVTTQPQSESSIQPPVAIPMPDAPVVEPSETTSLNPSAQTNYSSNEPLTES